MVGIYLLKMDSENLPDYKLIFPGIMNPSSWCWRGGGTWGGGVGGGGGGWGGLGGGGGGGEKGGGPTNTPTHKSDKIENISSLLIISLSLEVGRQARRQHCATIYWIFFLSHRLSKVQTEIYRI